MGISRMYTGDDGETHVEDLTLAEHPELLELMATHGVGFREQPAGAFSDFHPAPRRQYVITLSGEVEIGLVDGTVYRYGPGHVNLAEDVTGRGHTTRHDACGGRCAARDGDSAPGGRELGPRTTMGAAAS
jgi:hypothetical protein